MSRRTIVASVLVIVLTVAADTLTSDDDEDDSDPPAFMIVLEHENGWQCAASLVSMRSGVTTARCARGVGEVWARAASQLCARAHAPNALARRIARVALAGNGLDPHDPALDIAVIELEAPFGKEAKVQPILMATARGGFDEGSKCYAIRTLPAFGPTLNAVSRRVRFHVVNLLYASEMHCSEHMPHWATVRTNMLCFTGGELCERDMGGAVVCEGKLHGILSATAHAGEGARCGVTHTAQNIVHWRFFLHCAHTVRRCGRDTCENVCSEYQTLDENIVSTAIVLGSVTQSAKSTTNSVNLTTSLPSREELETSTDDAPPLQPSQVFEPNRADFRAAPSRTPRPALKAGEYGDNAAEYVAEEAPPARTSPAPRSLPAPSRTHEPRAAPPPAPALRAAPEPASASDGYTLSPNIISCLIRSFVCLLLSLMI